MLDMAGPMNMRHLFRKLKVIEDFMRNLERYRKKSNIGNAEPCRRIIEVIREPRGGGVP